MNNFKFVVTLKVTFEKNTGDKKAIKTGYFNSIAAIIINNNDINLNRPIQDIIKKIANWISEGSGWTIQSVDNHYINIVRYNPLEGNSFIKLPQELRNSLKGLINIKHNDKCFLWCHIRHLNLRKEHPERIKKYDKLFIEKLNYSGIEFRVSVKQFNKINKKPYGFIDGPFIPQDTQSKKSEYIESA